MENGFRVQVTKTCDVHLVLSVESLILWKTICHVITTHTCPLERLHGGEKKSMVNSQREEKGTADKWLSLQENPPAPPRLHLDGIPYQHRYCSFMRHPQPNHPAKLFPNSSLTETEIIVFVVLSLYIWGLLQKEITNTYMKLKDQIENPWRTELHFLVFQDWDKDLQALSQILKQQKTVSYCKLSLTKIATQ